MTKTVIPSDRWKRLHHVCVGGVILAWVILVGVLFVFPRLEARAATAIALGTGPFLPHLWIGLRIWHDSRRTGIGIPIAMIAIRLFVSPILFSIILWQFPADRRIIAWSGSVVVIVFTSIEALVFAKGVGRL